MYNRKFKKIDEDNINKFINAFNEKFKILNNSEIQNPFNVEENSENKDTNLRLNKIINALEIICQHRNFFNEVDEIPGLGKEIIEIRNNYSNGNYGSNDDSRWNFLKDLGTYQVRNQLKEEQQKLENYLKY